MYKEIIISIIIIAFIITGDILTQKYTKKSIEDMNYELDQLKTEKLKQESVEEKIAKIDIKWNQMYQKLAYYIEHDELEKVETQLSEIKGNIETKEEKQGVPEINKCIFILNHIRNKESFKIQNIF